MRGRMSSKAVRSGASWHPLPVRLVDEVMPTLKDTELRVLLVILRATWGWRANRIDGDGKHKRRDWLSHSQLRRRTGRGSDAVSGAVASLTAAGLIVVEDAGGSPLATPEERRRILGRLYFRLGDMWETEAGRGIDTVLWKSGQPTTRAVREKPKRQQTNI